jgi:hypothetical protein
VGLVSYALAGRFLLDCIFSRKIKENERKKKKGDCKKKKTSYSSNYPCKKHVLMPSPLCKEIYCGVF